LSRQVNRARSQKGINREEARAASPVPRFVYLKVSRCSLNAIGVHIPSQNKLVNEDLKWLQSHGAEVKDIRFEIHNDPSLASLAATIVFLVTYDAPSPVAVQK